MNETWTSNMPEKDESLKKNLHYQNFLVRKTRILEVILKCSNYSGN